MNPPGTLQPRHLIGKRTSRAGFHIRSVHFSIAAFIVRAVWRAAERGVRQGRPYTEGARLSDEPVVQVVAVLVQPGYVVGHTLKYLAYGALGGGHWVSIEEFPDLLAFPLGGKHP